VDVLNLKCGQCGHINELPENWSQPVAFCAKCGHKLHVPRPQDMPDDEQADLPEEEEVGFAEQARKSEGRKISVTCPQCGKTVTVSARVAGRKARCKACDAPMEIPYPDDLEPSDLPQPRRGAKETGLDLVAPGEMSASAGPAVAPPDKRDAMLDLLPEPIQDAVDDEGTHEPLQLVIPLTQHDTPPPRGPRTRHRRPADVEPDAPDAVARMAGEADSQPAAQPESAEAGQLANAVKDFQADRQAVLARHRRAARIRSLVWLAAVTAACAALVVPAVMYWPVLFPKKEHFVDITDNPTAGGTNHLPGNGQTVGTRPTTGKAVAVAGTGSGAKTRPIAQPPPVRAKCDVVGLVTQTFGPGGYHPAALGSVYWRLTAELTAGKMAIEFQAMGKDVQLVFAGRAVDSLGVPNDSPAGAGLLPRMGRQETISLKPRESRQVMLLFEVPTGIPEGELVIGKLKWPFRVAQEPASIPPANLAGTFVESPPRNLRPMLADPVMSAIQSVGQQHLAVRANGDGLEVEIPEAHVRGLASPAGRDVYAVALTCGAHKLAANLRFVEGGRTAILYLDTKAFHQITYVNPARLVPNVPTAVSAAGREPQATPRAPSRDEDGSGRTYTPPKSKPEPEEPISLPTGPSFFD